MTRSSNQQRALDSDTGHQPSLFPAFSINLSRRCATTRTPISRLQGICEETLGEAHGSRDSGRRVLVDVIFSGIIGAAAVAAPGTPQLSC